MDAWLSIRFWGEAIYDGPLKMKHWTSEPKKKSTDTSCCLPMTDPAGAGNANIDKGFFFLMGHTIYIYI